MSYNNSIPQPNDLLSTSQGQIKQNFLSADTAFGVDHTPFSTTVNSGYHKIIHQPYQNSNPANITDINQLYTRNITPDATVTNNDTQLFSLTGKGTLAQMTGNLLGTEGYQWCAGMLIQWGKKTSGSSGSFASGQCFGSVTFKDRVAGAIPFPNNLFTVYAVPLYAANPNDGSHGGPNSAGALGINTNNFSKTGFQWSFNSLSGAYTGMFWVAIGN